MLPALQRLNTQREMFTRLSEFQKSVVTAPAVLPTLPAVLNAVLPALEAGFAYSVRHCNGELTVTLHYQDAEIGSSAPASLESYGDTTARLLACLLGVPLKELDDASEAEHRPSEALPVVIDTASPGAASPEAPAAAAQPEATDDLEEEEEFNDLEPEDVTRPLTDSEKATAVDMVKVLPVDQRKAFTKAFREVFAVPADAKQIVPFITELRHLQFIDRFTVEATGGIAA